MIYLANSITANPLVSVVIPCVNPLDAFYTITSIRHQTHKNIELIIVAKSPIETKDLRSRQKNQGISASRGDYIFCMDADLFLQPNGIENALSSITNYDFVSINHKSIPHNDILSRIRSIEWETHTNDYLHVAGNFFRRSILPPNPYNESLSAGEDYDLHNHLIKKGYRFTIVPETFTTHLGEPSSLKDVILKNVQTYGPNIATFISRNSIIQVQPFHLAYLRFIPRFRLLFFPFLVYKFIQYTSTIIGMVFK